MKQTVCRLCGEAVQDFLTVKFNGYPLCSLRCHGRAVQSIEGAKTVVLYAQRQEQQPVGNMLRRYQRAQELLKHFDEPLPVTEQDLNPDVIHSRVSEYERAQWRGYALPWC